MSNQALPQHGKRRFMKENNIIVGFHTGRGGEFYNAGYVRFLPDVESLQDCSGDDDIIVNDDPETGEILPDDEWKLLDSGDNVILQGRDEIESDTGVLDYDGIYDRYDVLYLEDCDENQLDAIFKAYQNGDVYVSKYDKRLNYIIDYVCEHNGYTRIHHADFFDTHALVFDNSGKHTVRYDNCRTWEEVVDVCQRYCDEQNVEPESRSEFLDSAEFYARRRL